MAFHSGESSSEEDSTGTNASYKLPHSQRRRLARLKRNEDELLARGQTLHAQPLEEAPSIGNT